MNQQKYWNKRETKRLIYLLSLNKYSYKEIAKRLKRSYLSCKTKAERLGYRNNLGKTLKNKYTHLYEKVLTYRIHHTPEETANYFNLTREELRICLNAAYLKPEFRHIRKVNFKKRSEISLEHLLFFCKHSGIKNRHWLSEQLKKRNPRMLKHAIDLGDGTRYLNGIPETWAKELLDDPWLRGLNGSIRIMPWVTLERLIVDTDISDNIKIGIRALARFQRWIFNVSTEKEVIDSINKIINENY